MLVAGALACIYCVRLEMEPWRDFGLMPGLRGGRAFTFQVIFLTIRYQPAGAVEGTELMQGEPGPVVPVSSSRCFSAGY